LITVCDLSKSRLKPDSVYLPERRFYSLDGRSKSARFLRDYRRALINALDHQPSIHELTIVERCAILAYKCAVIDAQIITGTDSGLDGHEILAWTNTLSKLLRHDLKLKGPPEIKPPSLAEHLAARRAAGKDAAA
jgi:hypothetical protein